MKKMITRSFRLTEKQDRSLIDEAEKQGISVGTLISKILVKYGTLQRFAEKRGEVRFNPVTIKEIIECSDENKLSEIGRKIGRSFPQLCLMSMELPFNYSNCIFFLTKVLGDYANWYNWSVVESNETKTFLLYDNNMLGPKWQIFVMNYVSAMFESIIKVKVKAMIEPNSTIIQIPQLPIVCESQEFGPNSGRRVNGEAPERPKKEGKM